LCQIGCDKRRGWKDSLTPHSIGGGAILRLSRLVREALDKLPMPEDVAVAVDVDPYQLL